MDNLKNLEQQIEQQIDPNGAPGSILAINHQSILKEVLFKVGKYTGSAFIAKKNATTFPPGTFSWNGNALNNTNNFVIRTANKTADLNDFGRVLNTMTNGDLIRFKDYVGRSVFLNYQSHTNALDANGNSVWDITVNGFVDNPNYIYQDNESTVAVVTINKTTGIAQSYVDQQDQEFLDLAKLYTDEQIAGVSQPKVLEFALNHQQNLDFAPFMRWRFPGIPEFSLTKNITLSPSDATLDRIDVIAGNKSGDIVVIQGTPATEPAKPNINPDTEIEVTFILIKAGTTTPDGITNTTIYDENTQVAGGEFNTEEGTGGLRINLESTVDAYSGTKSIEGTNLKVYDAIVFTPNAPIPISEINELKLWIKNKYDINPDDPFRIQIDGNNSMGFTTALFLSKPSQVGYLPTSLNWQSLSFGIQSTQIVEVTKIRWSNYASDSDQFGMFMDLLTYSGGTVEPEPSPVSISVQNTNDVEQFKISDLVRFGNVTFDPATKTITPIVPTGGTVSVENRFTTITDLLSNQNIQTEKAIQYVDDASTDTTVDSGFAYYEYLGTTAGTLADYRKLSEEESMDIVKDDTTLVTNTNSIDFSKSKIFHTSSAPTTGNLLNDNTNAKIGIIQKIYHDDSVEPEFPSTWKKAGDGLYLSSASAESKVNVIFAEWESSTRQVYWIIQETL